VAHGNKATFDAVNFVCHSCENVNTRARSLGGKQGYRSESFEVVDGDSCIEKIGS